MNRKRLFVLSLLLLLTSSPLICQGRTATDEDVLMKKALPVWAAGREKEIQDYFFSMADRTGTLWEHMGNYASCDHGWKALQPVHGIYAVFVTARSRTQNLHANCMDEFCRRKAFMQIAWTNFADAKPSCKLHGRILHAQFLHANYMNKYCADGCLPAVVMADPDPPSPNHKKETFFAIGDPASWCGMCLSFFGDKTW